MRKTLKDVMEFNSELPDHPRTFTSLQEAIIASMDKIHSYAYYVEEGSDERAMLINGRIITIYSNYEPPRTFKTKFR